MSMRKVYMNKSIRVRTIRDIGALPPEARTVRIVRFLSGRGARLLLERCPKLRRVILTRTARRSINRRTLECLQAGGVDVIQDYSGQGRPVKFSRRDLKRMIELRGRGWSHEKIASKLGISTSAVSRALAGHTKFCRWGEDYNGGGREVWMITRDADPDARRLADNHYSRKTKGAPLFCGPGEKLVLISPDKKALFVWRKNRYRQDGQEGVECTLFRNEGAHISSELIREAVKLARRKWPGERLFTYVWPSALKSTNPGFCFLRAGWRVVGWNSGKRHKLLLLEAH